MKGPETRSRAHGEDIKIAQKKPRTESKKSPEEHTKAAKNEGPDNFDELLKLLKENVSVDDLRSILRENGQEASETASDESIFEICADQMMYGPLKRCPACGGALELSGGNYKCTGFVSEWTKCHFCTRDPPREGGDDWNIPEGVMSGFIKEWAKKYQGKHKRPKREHPSDKIFSGMTIAFAGRMSRPQYVLRQEIEKHGGRVSNAVREGVNCVVAPYSELERGGSSKLVDATDKSIPVVRESWLLESIQKGEALPIEGYNMAAELPGGQGIPWSKRAPEDEAAESLMAELKLYGKRGVYKDTELQDGGGFIVERDGILFNCAFSVCDQAVGFNEYCVMQIIGMPKDDKHYLYFKKGRVGDGLNVEERLDEGTQLEETIREFKRLFEELTGNDFDAWERHKKFEKKRLKFYPIDMDDGIDVRHGGLAARQLGIAAAHTKLHPKVAELLKFLFSQEVYRFAMTEMAIDAPDLPTGMLTDVHLKKCEEVLLEFSEALRQKTESHEKREAVCLDFSNRWFTLLHSTRPFIIHDMQQLADEVAPTLEGVRDITFASRLIGDMTGSTLDDPLSDRYSKLGCSIYCLEKDTEDYDMILKYLQKTFEPIRYRDGSFGVIVEDIFKVDGNSPPYEEVVKISNKLLLWCGTRTSNIVRHLKQGFLPAIFSAPAPGYMFGKGIYCTDAASMAANYGFTAVDRKEGFLMLAVVGLGEKPALEMSEAPEDTGRLEREKVAVKGVGKKTTDPEEHFTWKDEVTVPCGSLISSGHDKSPMEYNEYVVYDPKQVPPETPKLFLHFSSSSIQSKKGCEHLQMILLLQVCLQFMVKVRFEVVA